MIIAKTREEHLKVLNKITDALAVVIPNGGAAEMCSELSYSVGYLLGQNEMLKLQVGVVDQAKETK